MKVYFIAGLGANKRAFEFLDLSWCEPVFIDWLPPLPNETLANYALRLRRNIPEQSPIIVGVSFGGMLATEIAKADPGVKAVIISSNKTSAEFPAYLRMWRYLPVYKWVSPNLVNRMRKLFRRSIGPQGKLQRETFYKIMEETDLAFTRWAVDAILHWKSTIIPPNVVHIHGSGDRLLPMRFVKPHHVIKNGRHIMIMDNADELSVLLKDILLKTLPDGPAEGMS